jgi:hypothetical protein
MISAPRDTGDRDAPPDDGASAHAHGSFFGRRKGHKLRIHQADLIDNLLPHLALDIAAPAPARLADLFDGDIEDVRLEIGFGGGEHLIAEAQAFPNIGFIGCEPYVNGMAKILAQIEAHNIGNIRLYAGDADYAIFPEKEPSPGAVNPEDKIAKVFGGQLYLSQRLRTVLSNAESEAERLKDALHESHETEKQLRRGVHRSTRELEAAIRRYIELTNIHPKPFVWTKTADQILASVARFCHRISNSGH